MDIHHTAIVSPDAEIGENVRIGPYAIVGGPTVLGRGTIISSHAIIHPHVRLGEDNFIDVHATLGGDPQLLNFQAQNIWLEIGDSNIIREFVTIHRATVADTPTRIGSGCYIMAGAHIAHDCQLADEIVVSSKVSMAGHVEVGRKAVIGSMAAIHQFARIGAYAMVGAGSKVSQDIIPCMLADGRPARHYRLNSVGLKRQGINGSQYRLLEQAARLLRNGLPLDMLGPDQFVDEIRRFVAGISRRRLASFHKRKNREAD